MEEAQQIAQDFISSLDNLPAELKFIMEEIRLKEQETMDLQHGINRKIQRVNPRLNHPGTNRASMDGNLLEKIQPDLDRIDYLADAKVELAERLVMLMQRTCGRLEHDINRVKGPPATETPFFSTQEVPRSEKMLDGIRTAISIPDSAPSPPGGTPNGPAFKRRRVGSSAAGTISDGPVVLSRIPPPQRMSRLSGTFNPRSSPPLMSRRGGASHPPHRDGTGEEHEEGDDPADTEDRQLYCFCRKLSYGEMIGCDNETCQYQWFHLSCVGLKPPLPETWYCSECIGLRGPQVDQGPGGGGERAGRKGRKK